MTKLNVGDQAPDFDLPVSATKKIKLSELKGQFVVLYFYPKDDTPGCTVEAKGFNDLKADFQAANALIVGVSKDNLAAHEKFKNKYCLDFDLVSDADSNTCENYGVWVLKTMFGKPYMGVTRITFLIDKEGKIAYIWSKVSVSEHAKEVLDMIKKIAN